MGEEEGEGGGGGEGEGEGEGETTRREATFLSLINVWTMMYSLFSIA